MTIDSLFPEPDPIPPGMPYVQAYFERLEDGTYTMHWRVHGVRNDQLAYMAARLLAEAVHEP